MAPQNCDCGEVGGNGACAAAPVVITEENRVGGASQRPPGQGDGSSGRTIYGQLDESITAADE